MAKNYMAAVAKMLGMELGEEFIIENQDRKETVVISLDGFHVIQPNNVLGPDHGKLLSKVLQGLYEVKKKPWEPKEGDKVWSFRCAGYPIWSGIAWMYWNGAPWQLALKALGMVYHTRKEAEAHYAEDYEKLTGKPLTSVE